MATFKTEADCLPNRNIFLAERRHDFLAVKPLQYEFVHLDLLLERQAVLETGRVFLGEVIEQVGGPVVLSGRSDQSHRACSQGSYRDHLRCQRIDSLDSFRIPAGPGIPAVLVRYHRIEPEADGPSGFLHL